MSALASVPLEVLFLVTAYLPIEDIKSLRFTCKELHERAQPAYNDELYGRRTYFATIPDLQALLNFTKHPSKANLRLKHLRLDVASPYIHIRPSLFRTILEEDPKELKPPELFHREGFIVHNSHFEALEQTEDQALLFAALQNLPNLEIIEFVDRPGPPSEKSLAMHYPTLMTRRYRDEFLIFYKEYASRQKRGRLSSLFSYMITALKNSPCRIKEILLGDPVHPYMLVTHGMFHILRRHLKDMQPAFENLRILELNLTQPSHDYSGPLGFDPIFGIPGNNDTLQCIPEFLREVLPNTETLKLRFEDVVGDFRFDQRHGNSISFDPNMLLMKVELNLPRLKRLELQMIPFKEAELKDGVLKPHRGTLRHLLFEDCTLQEEPQMWSSVFEMLEDELSLDSFSFFTKSIDRKLRIGKIPNVFKVSGNVNSGRHVCEVRISRKNDLVNTTFKGGLKLVQAFEETLARNAARSNDPFNNNPILHSDDDLLNPLDNANGAHMHDDAFDDWDDEFDDDDFGPPLPMMPFLPGIGPPPHLHIHPPGPIAPPPQPIELYTAQPDPNGIPDHLFPGLQSAPIDPTGNFRRIGIPGIGPPNNTHPPGSVAIPSFIIPATYLNTAALEGQPRTAQNILRNLTANALDIGVNVTPQDAGDTAGGAAGPSTGPAAGPSTGPTLGLLSPFDFSNILPYFNN
ncbi:hypothetical protein H072_11253 [Dactylellina haptotyla CBS 200.50]|uniref:F-box domain-containing protein n=1 Tax=Dactylellina haptotyla (strain CBS 200.50) TaxID=1284197 RepID=S8A2L0_DACHA|nr:hypothetical protein H072_11253 [Dactylellina haptotyla CBS 200.50]